MHLVMKKLILKSRSLRITTSVADDVARAMTRAVWRIGKQVARNFFRESPLFRMMYRCGRARKQMRSYRALKGIKRPGRFRQDVW